MFRHLPVDPCDADPGAAHPRDVTEDDLGQRWCALRSGQYSARYSHTRRLWQRSAVASLQRRTVGTTKSSELSRVSTSRSANKATKRRSYSRQVIPSFL